MKEHKRTAKVMVHKDYYIIFNPPPVPSRAHDFQWWHKDYDGPGDERHGSAATLHDAVMQIEEMIEEVRDGTSSSQ